MQGAGTAWAERGWIGDDGCRRHQCAQTVGSVLFPKRLIFKGQHPIRKVDKFAVHLIK